MEIRNKNVLSQRKRTRAYYRHQRNRAIARKKRIFSMYWRNGEPWFPVGKWNKGKVHCSCKLCRYEQYHGIPKLKYAMKEKWMKQEIDEFLTAI